jgi:hypothetical protein
MFTEYIQYRHVYEFCQLKCVQTPEHIKVYSVPPALDFNQEGKNCCFFDSYWQDFAVCCKFQKWYIKYKTCPSAGFLLTAKNFSCERGAAQSLNS